MAAPRRPLIDVREIEALLEQRIESLVGELLPNARKDGKEMCVGSIHGEPGQSLRIHVGAGSRRGWWVDFAGGEDKGDALKLVAVVLFGGDIKRAVAWAKGWLGLDDSDPARIERVKLQARAHAEQKARDASVEEERARQGARRRWHQAAPLSRGDLVATYLARRGIDLTQLGRAPGAIRYHEALQYGFGEGSVVLPAMVSMITNLAGEHIATHRTWLKPDGSDKAGVAELGVDHRGRPRDAKKVMGKYLGGHIPIWKGAQACPLRDIAPGTDIYVSEGVEDGLTAAIADPSLRIVAMIALSNLIDLQLPPQMGRLILLNQNDPPGSKADQAKRRGIAHHRAQGRRVFLVSPPAGAKDLNALTDRRGADDNDKHARGAA
ncbi:MAG: toprim domain-containing protein [Sphingopyxis sp.]